MTYVIKPIPMYRQSQRKESVLYRLFTFVQDYNANRAYEKFSRARPEFVLDEDRPNYFVGTLPFNGDVCIINMGEKSRKTEKIEFIDFNAYNCDDVIRVYAMFKDIVKIKELECDWAELNDYINEMLPLSKVRFNDDN